MRSLVTTDLPAELVRLTAHLALEAPSAAPGPADRPWSVPLLVTPAAEAWLLGWPAGLVTPAHDHGSATVAVTVVDGTLSEECLDPTIWTTGRRTTWRAGATTVFPPGHVHLLGAAGDRPAVAVHAWSGPVGQAAVPQAGLRWAEPEERLAGALVEDVTPPSPSGSARVVAVTAAGRVMRRTARWILSTSGIG